MTDSNGNTHAQPGWYADPAGSAQNRWWDGTQWTEHMQAPVFADYRAVAAPPPVAPGTPVYNPFIWVIALLPVVSLISTSLFDMSGYVVGSVYSRSTAPLGGWYLVVTIVGWIVYLGTVLLAYFDWRKLRQTGFVKPFHWAWAFLSAGVYVIGRSVIVRRRAGHGLIPIWIWAGITVIIMIVVLVKLVHLIAVLTVLAPTLH